MEMTPALKALADENRLRIVGLLLRRAHCGRSLARELGVSEAAVSQHLRVLRQAGLLAGQRRGRFMHYAVDRQALMALAGELEALAALQPSPDAQACAQLSTHCHCHAGCKGGHNTGRQ